MANWANIKSPKGLVEDRRKKSSRDATIRKADDKGATMFLNLNSPKPKRKIGNLYFRD